MDRLNNITTKEDADDDDDDGYILREITDI